MLFIRLSGVAEDNVFKWLLPKGSSIVVIKIKSELILKCLTLIRQSVKNAVSWAYVSEGRPPAEIFSDLKVTFTERNSFWLLFNIRVDHHGHFHLWSSWKMAPRRFTQWKRRGGCFGSVSCCSAVSIICSSVGKMVTQTLKPIIINAWLKILITANISRQQQPTRENDRVRSTYYVTSNAIHHITTYGSNNFITRWGGTKIKFENKQKTKQIYCPRRR